MPRATTGREDARFVQLSSDSPHTLTREPLGPQVFHDLPQVRRTVRAVRLEPGNCPLVTHVLTS